MHEPCTPVADERKTLVQIVLASIVLCIFFPSGMLLHESGHYLAATCAGAEPDFSYRRVTYSRENLSELADAVIQAAGPSIEVVFVLTGMLLIHITRARKRSELPGLRFWIGTALVLSSIGFGFGIIGFILWHREIGPRLIPV